VSDSPLEQARVIYAPFDQAETRRLRQFVADVEELAASSFFQAPGGKITISGGVDLPLTTDLPYAGEEAVRAVVGIFRQLYSHKEPTSFNALRNSLSEHIRQHPSPLQRDALDAIKELHAVEKQILRGEGQIALVTTRRQADGTEVSEKLTPRLLIELFLHGHYLHKGNEKADKLAQWPIPDIARHAFFGAILDLRNLYWSARNIVLRILRCPELLDAPVRPS
jgi:hypothetical protein